MKKRWRIAIGAGFLAVAAVAIRWQWGRHWQSITVGKDTTWVTWPLRADGTVDYIGALNERYGAGVTAENNAAVPLIKLVKEYPAAMMAQYAELMHAPELAEPAGVRFEAWMEYRERVAGGEITPAQKDEWYDEEKGILSDGWTDLKHPEAAAWLKANAQALERVEEAAGRERYFVPLLRRDECTTVLEANIGSLGAAREMANAVAARGMKRLAEGDFAGSWGDSMVVIRLGYLFGQEGETMWRLVGLAVIDLGLQMEAKILSRKVWNAVEAARMRGELERLGEPPSFVECIDWVDRMIALDNLTVVARFGPDASGCGGGTPAPAGPFAFGLFPLQFDPAMRNTNLWMDHLAAAASEKRFEVREAALEKVRAEAMRATPAPGSSREGAIKNLSMINADTDYRNYFRTQANIEQMRELVIDALLGGEYFSGHELREAEAANWAKGLANDVFAEKPIVVLLRNHALVLTCEGPEPLAESGAGLLGIKAASRPRRDFRVEVLLR